MQITAENVTKRYGTVTALDECSLSVPSGTTTGLLGTNGAGKSTLFRLLTGLDRPDSGRLTVGGMSVAEAGTAIRERVGYLPEHVGFPDALTGREVLAFHARVRGLPRDGRIDETIETVGLSAEAADRAVGGYSNGMRRRLGLAAAILPEPGVLLLDEPTAGLDPRGVATFHEIVERIRDRRAVTILVSSHALAEIERLCDRICVIDDGGVRREGTVADLVGETGRTVRVRPADPADCDAVAEILAAVATNVPDTTTDEDAVGELTITDGAVRVRASPDRIPALFAALEDGPAVADVDVETAGLEAAFHRAIGDDVTDDAGDAPGEVVA